MLGASETAPAQARTATTTTLAVTSSNGPVTTVPSGAVVTLTATVKAGSSLVSPGQVNFCDASAKYCTDIHLLGTEQLSGTGTVVFKFRPGIGKHSYKAVFSGTKTYAGSSSSASALAVTGAFPPLGTAETINQTGSWGVYALSATVTETGNTAPPTGTVSFLDKNHGNAVVGAGMLGSATRGLAWTNVNTSAPSLAGVYYAVADLNRDGIPDLFVEDYFGTYDVFLGNGDGTFAAKGSAFGPSSETGSFILGDFNNDGIPDVAAIHSSYSGSGSTITIFLGNGDGTFTVAGSSPAIGMNPGGITTADINGDGNADLVVSQMDSTGKGEIAVFFGHGDGTFTQSSSPNSVGSTAASIIPADINGDSNIDLVLTGLGQSGITILLGKGDGTFTVVAGPTQAGEATASVADLNNDGFPDLVFGAAGASDLTVFLGNGDGTFTEAPSGPNGNLVVGNFLTIGDLNQDGIPDVVYGDQSTTGVLFGKGDGTFVQFPTTLTFDSYGFGTAFVVADFNGDGWPDVLAIEGSGRTIADSLTQPTETATASATVSIASGGSHLVDASYPGDANYGAGTSGTVSLWGAPPATTTTLAVTSGGAHVTSVSADSVVVLTATVMTGASPVTAGQVSFCDASATRCADLHLLGTVHLTSSGTAQFKFVPGPGTHSYKAMFVEDGYGLSSSSAVSTLSVGNEPVVYSDTTTITTGGYPGDYSLTATVVGYGGSAPPTGSVSFLDTSFANKSLGAAPLGTSTAGLGWLTSQTPGLTNTPVSGVPGDFNGDGIPDLALLWSANAYGGPYSVTFLFGKGDSTFTTGPTLQLTGVQSNPTMIAGDFNGDGKTDLAVLSGNGYSSSYLTTLLGNGDGTFGAPLTMTVFNQGAGGGNGSSQSMVAADFNGDGKLDLAVVGQYVSPGGVAILLGNGDGTFTTAAANIAPGGDFGVIATGDFNRDGIPDLVVAGTYDSPVGNTVFLGKGDGTFTAVAMPPAANSVFQSIVVGDFNGDGKTDLAFGDNSAVAVFLSNGDGTFYAAAGSPFYNSGLSLVAGDFNHDGKLDLAAIGGTNYNNSYQIDLYLGAGDGTFTPTTTPPITTQSFYSPFAIVAADFNGDGVPDLAALTNIANTASILITEPTQVATATLSGVAPVGVGTHNVEASYPGNTNYPAVISGTVALTAGLAPPVISPAAGSYSSIQSVTITESIPGATIYYSAYGIVNTNGLVPYTGPIKLNEGGIETIQAYATETGYQDSNYSTASYSINLPAASVPVFSPAAGRYAGTQTVTISDTVPGAAIYYTTNGLLPTAYSAQYTGPITVSSSETLVASAAASGYSMSAPASAQYLIGTSSVPLIYTFAGDGSDGYGGDGGPAPLADLNSPAATVLDAAGNLYIADEYNYLVRKVAAGTGIITTYAGNGTPGVTGDNGPATSAEIGPVSGLAVDKAGNLFISDWYYSVIRKVAAGTGIITTYAGNRSPNPGGDNGPATDAALDYPQGLACDSTGNLYLVDSARIRMIAAKTGIITAYAGNGGAGYLGDGGPAIDAEFQNPVGLATDSSGNLYIADSRNNVIREVFAGSGMITTVAGTAPQSWYPSAGYSGDGGPATNAKLNYPQGVAVDGVGNLFIADSENNVIRKVNASNQIISTVAGNTSSGLFGSGDGGPATSATVIEPQGIAVDSAGNLFIAEPYAEKVLEVVASNPPPTTPTVAPVFSVSAGTYPGPRTVTITDSNPRAAIYMTVDGSTPTTGSLEYNNAPINLSGTLTLKAMAIAPGYLQSSPVTAAYTITSSPTAVITTVAGSGVYGFSGANGPATSADLGSLEFLAVDGSGNVYIADAQDAVVWKMSAKTGVISIAAGNGTRANQFNVGDGGPATSAQLGAPLGVALDSKGNLYVSDEEWHVVRKVDATTKIISTFAGNGQISYSGGNGDGGKATAAELNYPAGLACDKNDNLYIADSNGAAIRMVSASTGIITTFAGNGTFGYSGDGGPATKAEVETPYALAFDGNGNLYFSDGGESIIRMVSASSGVITTVAGKGGGNSGDGGLATSAGINVNGLAADSEGNLYVANPPGSVREISAKTGIINTIAGNGYCGYFGDGGSATIAELCYPRGIAFNAAGDLYIADSQNQRVRQVTFAPSAPTPLLSLATGSYKGTQSVTVTDTLKGATIYYTTDGTAPTFESNLYSGPIKVTASETLEAIATANSYRPSAPASATYTIIPLPVPAISWKNPAAIAYGTPLSATQLNATSTVKGTFTYSPSAGTVLGVGVQTLSVTFTPSDATSYSTATASVTVTVNPATPSITWAKPAAITYGTALSATQLNATSKTAGTFAYSPATGRVLDAGSQTLSTTFTPTDTNTYTTATDSVTLTVNKVAQTITFTAPATPVTYGVTPITLIAKAGSNLPVTFTVTSGPATVNGNTLTITGVGSVAVAANQSGNNDYSAATAVSKTITVSKFTPTVGLSSTPSSFAYGTSAKLTATLNNAGGNSAAPTGTVTFLSGTTSLGTGTLNSAGVATLTLSTLPVGNDSITASYGGDSNYAVAKSSTTSIAVSKATQTINFTAPVSPVTYGVTPIALKAKSTSGLAVTFTVSSGSPATVNGSTLTITGVGSVTINANQAGNSSYSAAPAVQQIITVSLGTATGKLTSSAANVTYGTSVTLTANFTGSGSARPAGTVTFLNGSTSVGTGTLNASGVATLAVTTLPVGTDSLTANFPADTHYAAATTAALSETVKQATPTVKLTASATSAAFGASVTLTATLTGAGAKPTGTVTFVNGATALGAGPVAPNSSGVATLTLSTLPVGADSIKASYSGDTSYAAATSTATTVTIGKGTQAIVFTAPTTPVTYGVTPVTLIATGGASGLPVTFTVTGPASINGSTLAITGAGSVVVTANQAGNSNYAAATAVSKTIAVNKATPTNSLQAAPTSAVTGSPVTFTATLSGVATGAVPTGIVTFLDGTTSLGTGSLAKGVATYSTTKLTTGSHNITAKYAGDSNYIAVTSSAASVTINAASK
jgi:hypothetical protein